MFLREPIAKHFAIRFRYHATQRAHKPALARKRLETRAARVQISAATRRVACAIDAQRAMLDDDAGEPRTQVARVASDTGADRLAARHQTFPRSGAFTTRGIAILAGGRGRRRILCFVRRQVGGGGRGRGGLALLRGAVRS